MGGGTKRPKRDLAPGVAAELGAAPASLSELTESILRRIMRVACVVGALGILNPLLSGRPYDPLALGISAAVTVFVFLATFVPMRVRLLSYIYPWGLVLVGASLALLMGPTHPAILLVSGGLFIGSLVLSLPALLAIVVSTTALLTFAALQGPGATEPEHLDVWRNITSAMVAVIAPAAVAGRMLVSALSRALAERSALIEELTEEHQVLQETIVTLESTRHQLTQAQKLELVSQMAGGIAHDMNNALTAVIGETSLLGEAVAEERERILEASEYAAKLTQQLMVFGRSDTSRPRPIELGSTLTSFERSIRRIMPSDVAVATKVPPDPVVVDVDPTQLLQIVLNLAANARDAMPGGGHLDITLEHDRKEARAMIRVSDTGHGIPSDTLPHIFDPFFTTKPAGKGTGLGLSNVQQLVDGMNGAIDVHSEAHEGTRFVITLPTTEEPIASAAVELTQATERAATILVVDDDVRVRAMVFTALERLGHRVLEAPHARAAAELAKSHRGTIDLLVTDVVMAEGGGAEVIFQVRSVLPDVRVLVMSGYADDEAMRRGIAEGKYPFLQKPFTSDQLAVAVDRALVG